MTSTRRPQVFAVEPDAVQLTWRRLPPGALTVVVEGPAGTAETTVEGDGGPGALTVRDLAPDADHTVTVVAGDQTCRLALRTPAPPPGAELYRFATLSDTHLGQTTFGLLDRMHEPDAEVAHTERCFGAALDEAVAWGARHLVLKGDVVHRGTVEEYELLGKLLAPTGLPTEVVAGNHETKSYREVDHVDGFAGIGLESSPALRTVDLPGLRLALLDSSLIGHHHGRLDHLIDDVGPALGGRPSMVVLHHQLLRLPLPTSWPPGILSGPANRLLDTVADAAPTAVVASGHTHRHRTRHHRNVVVTETGSPKDHPGTWTGYVVHEGGIRQVVHRVERPDCIRWTEHTRKAALGVWGHWSPGHLTDRCWTLPWADGASAG